MALQQPLSIDLTQELKSISDQFEKFLRFAAHRLLTMQPRAHILCKLRIVR